MRDGRGLGGGRRRGRSDGAGAPSATGLAAPAALAARRRALPDGGGIERRYLIMMPLVRAFVCSWYVGVYIYIKLVLILPVGSPLHHCP